MRKVVRLIPLLLVVLLCACAQQAQKPPPPPPPVASATAKPVAPPLAPSPVIPKQKAALKPPPTPVAPSGTAQAAVILPLSGPQASLGTALLNAAQMALFELGDNELTLVPLDSKGTPEGALAAVHQALSQHVDIIVGPVFATEVRATAALAVEARVPMLSLSADSSVAGPGIYVMGFLPGPQALKMADFAASTGKLRQAVLAPSNDYGRRVVNALVNGAQPLGVTIGPIEYYDPQALDLSGPLKRLLAGRKGDDPGFDALFLPDDGQRLRRAAEQWALQGVEAGRVTLLGTMLWDEARTGDQPALAGGWYPVAPAKGFADFSRRYAKAFNAAPPRLASLAYDAFAIVAVLNRRAAHDFSPGILTNPQGFSGVDGLFRLKLDGHIERAYAIREVVPGGPPKEISPAPASFGS